ncbi:hypothetical protein FQP34_00150 [Peribacillus simplex]|uniref:Uncharacterized protein n=1 Tax=Peribacillus simplex TaxID=1478 RepID=A0A8B5Y5D0_9BACI|nr:hypothetical protein FQP34_00150 [Peribacillus simplex]
MIAFKFQTSKCNCYCVRPYNSYVITS